MLLEIAAGVYLAKTLLGAVPSIELEFHSPAEKPIANYKYKIPLKDIKNRAEEDNELVWLELGIRYYRGETGNCALKDNIEAYAWFSLGGNYSSNEIFYSLRDMVAEDMTPDTIHEGYELFEKRYYKIEEIRNMNKLIEQSLKKESVIDILIKAVTKVQVEE